MKSDRAKAIVAAGYDTIGDDYLRWSAEVVDTLRDRLFDEFVNLLPAQATVLDIGCGAGIPWTRALAQRFVTTGIDISPRQIEAARRNVAGATFVEGDVSSARFGASQFDGAIAFYSIANLPRDEHGPLLARLAGWLRPGGLLLASLPAGESVGGIEDWLGASMYFSGLGSDAYRVLLRNLRFDVIHIEETMIDEPDGPAWFLWILGRSPDERTGG
jgi:SAM-dependent methyltransferase